jgi:hypothetical protein
MSNGRGRHEDGEVLQWKGRGEGVLRRPGVRRGADDGEDKGLSELPRRERHGFREVDNLPLPSNLPWCFRPGNLPSRASRCATSSTTGRARARTRARWRGAPTSRTRTTSPATWVLALQPPPRAKHNKQQNGSDDVVKKPRLSLVSHSTVYLCVPVNPREPACEAATAEPIHHPTQSFSCGCTTCFRPCLNP